MSEKNYRNIILITLDSLRADHCSFMGYHRKTTPTIDRMARRGLYFENAMASGIPTPASMVGVFTGTYTYVDSTCTNPKSWRKEIMSRKTLAQVLSEKGYFTGAVHENAYVSKLFGFNKGFRYYNDGPTANLSRIKIKVYNTLLIPIFRKLGFSNEIPDIIMGVGTCSHWESYYDIIIDWVKKAEEPFFLWVLLLDTHTPYIPPKKFRRHCNIIQVYYYWWKLGKASRTKSKLSEKDIKKIIDIYDDCIYYADNFIKNIYTDTKDFDPILLIHADHGDGFGEHGVYQHASPFSLYEELIHVPLVIYNADVKGKIEKPISLLSIAPTILQLIGEENVFPSKSVFDYDKEYVISQVIENGKIKIAVRTKRWKFIMGQKDIDELYDLKRDPHEQENVIDEHQDLAKEMRKITLQHLKSIKHKRIISDVVRKLKP